LRDYAENSRRHLTVVGTHGGGMVYETLIGSTARKIIDAVPGARASRTRSRQAQGRLIFDDSCDRLD
jgi:hypothetical protein